MEIVLIHTKLSVLARIRDIEKLPKFSVSETLLESGGFENIQKQDELVRNRSQIYKMNPRVNKGKDKVIGLTD